MYTTITKCRVCGSDNIEPYLNLQKSPWCNGIVKKEDFDKEKFYPLRLAFCHNCTASNLLDTIPKEEMFSNHTYVSGTTKTLSKHFYNIAKDVTEKFNIQKDDLIIDIGGNDGTNLLQYRELGFNNLVNVESAKNIAQISLRNKITTLNKYFDKNITRTIYTPYVDRYSKESYSGDLEVELKKLVKAKVINASGVFFHLEDLHSVCEGIKNLLDEEGVFIVQFMYIDDIIKNLQFDSIYHEHLLFYTKKSLCILLEKYGLYPSEFYHSDIHGGSTIAYFTKKKISGFVIDEHPLLYDIKLYKDFAEKVEIYKDKLYYLLLDIKNKNKKIVGVGCPAKSTTFLNYIEINNNIIDVLLEKNNMKFDYYSPGTHIKIFDETEYLKNNKNIDYFLILSWNFYDEIKNNYKKYLETGAKIILPFPEIKILDINTF